MPSILKHSILPWKEGIGLANDILLFIIYEMENNQRNTFKEGTVGEQCDTFLEKETLSHIHLKVLCSVTQLKLGYLYLRIGKDLLV